MINNKTKINELIKTKQDWMMTTLKPFRFEFRLNSLMIKNKIKIFKVFRSQYTFQSLIKWLKMELRFNDDYIKAIQVFIYVWKFIKMIKNKTKIERWKHYSYLGFNLKKTNWVDWTITTLK